MEDIKIGVIGGDKRQGAAASRFLEKGFKVSCFGVAGADNANTLKEAVKDSKAVVLGIPYSCDGKYLNCTASGCEIPLNRLFECLEDGQLLLGGKLDKAFNETSKQYGIKAADYFECEELNILNAVISAEGAIELAVRELDITLHGANVLILGFGRIAKILAKDLCGMGAEVCVAQRSSVGRTWAQVYGYECCDIRNAALKAQKADIIFNTIPFILLDRVFLGNISYNTPVIDLASKPGGVDMDAARELGRRVIWALSLPGKVAPVSAGRIIADAVIDIMQGEGML